MGVLLKWKQPSSEANYDNVRIYRSDSENGSYSLIQTQTITDNSYYDPTGAGSYWYKIDFYDSVNGIASQQSDAIQGAEHVGYCTVDDVRTMTNIKSSQVTDTELACMIEYAAANLNTDISIRYNDEKVEYIQSDKSNSIDGTNLSFWVKNFPFGDRNNDFQLTSSDIEVYSINADGLKTTLTVTQVVGSTGNFRLQSAPENVDLYVSYVGLTNKNLSIDPAHSLVKQACIWLTAAYAYSKLNVGKAPRFRQGPLTVFRDTTAHKEYMQRYYDTLTKINTMVDTIEHEDAW